MLSDVARDKLHGTGPIAQSRPFSETAEDQMNAAGMICIGWVDQSRLTRETMAQAVASSQPLFLILPFENVRDCITYTERAMDLIVYHSHDAETVNLDHIKSLTGISATLKLVVLSDAPALDVAIVRKVLTRGASGFILTNRSGIQLVASALTLVASGGTFIPREILLRGPETPDFTWRPEVAGPRQLTQREIDVLHLVKEGNPNKIIAHRLKMSPATVKVHIRNMMRKMGVTNRTQAALHADRHLEPETGVLSPLVQETVVRRLAQH